MPVSIVVGETQMYETRGDLVSVPPIRHTDADTDADELQQMRKRTNNNKMG
jgi:hypothetical protein